ncbi:protein translocase subunit yajC [Anaerocolumna jejuensis DSM 15929]|jgi:preprotein translocase subunit YajC|uniref:Protein translocase subunit yajC n=1 Tax=Anaerocolumna jejuensis DSM 15929 TaxID=1121322 RepID=A0A1M6R8T3_9FIRM|nr:preprotein translocase subunit YajC [Anaerocolumna jejuensis]SHK28707.1 protein translocase subunit yajC [Anaerocolumna jejuensis DSM 15929]
MQFGILTGGAQGAMPLATLVMWIVVMVGIFYFMAIRPQKKQQKKMDAMMSTLENGDSVLTSGGFFGVVIDVMEDVVIVEFGNNKNCRIPMKKTAIAEIEKPQSAITAKETKE